MKDDAGWQRYWRFLSARFRRDVDDELAFHVEMRARELEARGLSADAARNEAERRFGDRTRVRDTLRRIERKRGRGMQLSFLLQELIQDVRFAARGLIKRPGFTVMTAGSLALGIAATTVVLSAIDAFLLRPLPVPNPGELVVVGASSRATGSMAAGVINLPTARDLAARTDLFQGVAAATSVTVAVRPAPADQAERHLFVGVTGNYFSLLGVSPALGRLIAREDDRERDRVVVLGHRMWRARFQGDPAVIGRRVRLNTLEFVVVGVAPPEFHGTEHVLEPDGYVPSAVVGVLESAPNDLESWRGPGRFTVIARRQPNRTIADIRSALRLVSGEIETAFPQVGEGFRLVAFAETRARPSLAAAGGTAVAAAVFATLALLVLLTASVNATNLILARGSARSTEMAVRQALGASRGRLVSQLLTETFLLALLALAAGWGLARLAIGALTSTPLEWNGLALSWGLSLDRRVFGMTVVVTLLIGLLAGVGPALAASRFALQQRLREGGRAGLSRRGRRARSALVVAQVAASLVVLASAGLFMASARQAARVDLGFRSDHLLTLGVDATLAHHDERTARIAFERIARAVERIPGVESLAWANMVPIKQGVGGLAEVQPNGHGALGVFTGSVGPGYFDVLEMPVLEGRGFDARDDSTRAPVVVLNQRAAETLWPGQSAVRRTIRLQRDGPAYEVIGVVTTSRYLLIGEAPRPYLYLSLAQQYAPARFLHVRTAVDPAGLVPAVRAAVATADQDVGAFDVRSMDDVLATSPNGLLLLRLAAGFAAAVGLLAVTLTLVGLYGVILYSVVQRTREIGLRIALGATRGTVVRSILKDGGRLAVAGIAIGVVVAVLISRVVGSLLVGSRSADLAIFLVVAVGLCLAALVSAYLPARRAARIDPVKALSEG